MPRNDDGEFELVLGNRQLLSVFFIVVVLLGVFFTMGYIVGRNSAPVIADVQKKAEKPLTVEPTITTETAPPPVSETAPPKETAQQLPVEVPAPQTETKSDKAEATPAPSPAPAKAAATEKAEKKKETKERAAPETAKKAKPSSDQPAVGQSYLQLAATTKREADVMVDVLRQKGFKAIAAEIQDKPGMFRVLVGPVAEGGRNALRADLQKSGFPGNAAIPRTF